MWDRRSQLEPFTISGTWWAAGSDEKRVAGDLRYDPHEGCWLNLMHHFEGNIPFPWNTMLASEWPVVHGKSVSGHDITLCAAFHGTSPFEQPGDHRYHIFANHCFIGGHLAPMETQLFDSVTLDLTAFVEWLGDRPIAVEEGDYSSEKPFVVCYVNPEGFNITVEAVDPPTQINVCTCLGLSQAGGATALSLEYQAKLRIEPSERRPFDWFYVQIARFCNLLSLLTGRQVETTHSLLRINGYTSDGQSTSKTTEVSHYFQRRAVAARTKWSIREVLKYPEVRDDWHKIVQAWIKSAERYPALHALYFSEHRHASAFMETRFLPLIQALDHFTAANDMGNFMLKTEFRNVKAILIAAIPPTCTEEFRDALIATIQWRNQRDIRPRIRTLIESMEDETRKLFCRSPQEFVDGLIDTRNYFTHYGDGANKYALTGLALHWATEKAKLLIRVILLKECDLDEKRFRDGLSKHMDAVGYRAVWEKLPESLR
jgi:ApeA N-terminal domain 1